MGEIQTSIPERVGAQSDELPAADAARNRLLASLPVAERRFLLAGISTAVLESGEGSPVVLLHGPQFGIPAIPSGELERIDVPTTLIWGRLDRATPLHVAEAASARFGWPLRVIEDCADDPPVERPEVLLRELHVDLGSGGRHAP